MESMNRGYRELDNERNDDIEDTHENESGVDNDNQGTTRVANIELTIE